MRRKVRDIKHKQKFFIEDVVVDIYGRFWGWNAQLVYMSLCRHANPRQLCFPSINLISKELGISRDSVIGGIKSLVDNHVIEKQQCHHPNNAWANNVYRLLNKSNWEPKLNELEDEIDGGSS